MSGGLKEQSNWYGICICTALMIKRSDRQRHILVVDDETLVRRSVHILLQADGYLVDEAKTGAEALALFEPGKFDMIFIDYLMPEMRGDALAAAIKKRSPQQPIVMLTAFVEKFQSAACPPGGVDSCIGKPFALETLRAVIDQYASD